MSSRGTFGHPGSTEDLGPRGRTQLRLILTPPPATPPAEPVVEMREKPVVTREHGATAPPKLSALDRLRRDTIVAHLLAAPEEGFLFITFTDTFVGSLLMTTTIPEDLRDEEREGGFDDAEGDDTFAPAAPPAAAKTVTATELPSAAPFAPALATHVVPRFPFRLVLFGLPVIALLVVVLFLAQWRHTSTTGQPREIDLAPTSSATPAPTAGSMPPPASAPSAADAPAHQPTSAAPDAGTHAASPAATPPVAAARKPVELAPVAVSGRYEIQVVATPSKIEAGRRAAALVAHGAHAFVAETERDGVTLYRVRVGPYQSESAARAAGSQLGLRSMWIERTGR